MRIASRKRLNELRTNLLKTTKHRRKYGKHKKRQNTDLFHLKAVLQTFFNFSRFFVLNIRFVRSFYYVVFKTIRQ